METQEEIDRRLAVVKEAVDYLCYKIDRAGPNIDAYINTIDLQALLVVQKVKHLKDAVEGR